MFEREKREPEPSFERVSRELHDRAGGVEASFASKMVAALDPDMPIWDGIVLGRLGLKPRTGACAEDRLADTVGIHREICRWYEWYLQADDAVRNLALFDRVLPGYASLSPTKKIDFLLWGGR